MIGNIGMVAVGQKVAMAGQAQGRWVIVKVRQQGAGWRYQLKDQFNQRRWVNDTDGNYDLVVAAPQAPSGDQLARINLINNRLVPGPAGDMAAWLGADNPKTVAAFAAIAASQARTGGEIRIVWSGGASDCVIVGLWTGEGRGAINHLDRASDPSDITGLRRAQRVYLASEKFTLAAAEAAGDELVARILNKILAENVQVTAIYPTKQLAIRSDGTVAAAFNPGPVNASAKDDLPHYA